MRGLGAEGPGRVRGVGEGRGVEGEGGRGHFIHLATHCTTTWCFAQKGLRTNGVVMLWSWSCSGPETPEPDG